MGLIDGDSGTKENRGRGRPRIYEDAYIDEMKARKHRPGRKPKRKHPHRSKYDQ